MTAQRPRASWAQSLWGWVTQGVFQRANQVSAQLPRPMGRLVTPFPDVGEAWAAMDAGDATWQEWWGRWGASVKHHNPQWVWAAATQKSWHEQLFGKPAGERQAARRLIGGGLTAALRRPDGTTALHEVWAASDVAPLIQAGLDPNGLGARGNVPLGRLMEHLVSDLRHGHYWSGQGAEAMSSNTVSDGMYEWGMRHREVSAYEAVWNALVAHGAHPTDDRIAQALVTEWKDWFNGWEGGAVTKPNYLPIAQEAWQFLGRVGLTAHPLVQAEVVGVYKAMDGQAASRDLLGRWLLAHETQQALGAALDQGAESERISVAPSRRRPRM